MALQAQPGTSTNKQVEYKTFMRLQPGEKAIPFYSCMWLNEKDEFITLKDQGHNGINENPEYLKKLEMILN